RARPEKSSRVSSARLGFSNSSSGCASGCAALLLLVLVRRESPAGLPPPGLLLLILRPLSPIPRCWVTWASSPHATSPELETSNNASAAGQVPIDGELRLIASSPWSDGSRPRTRRAVRRRSA